LSAAIDVSVEAEAWRDVPGAEAVVRRAAEAALHGRADAAELSLVLTDDQRIRELNRTWRGIDKPTNVLAFPGPTSAPAPRMLGDVVIACETVLREAAEMNIAASDHLAHLAVHGILHLLGYDHEADDAAEAMEDVEREILAGLGIADPYAAMREHAA
jgi:probable rRNA maturation factor